MYDLDTRKRALALVAQGFSQNSVSKQTGISRAAIRSWLQRIEPLGHKPGAECPRCSDTPRLPDDPAAYSYLLCLYLGDGCVSAAKRGVYSLRIACADAWPGLIDACVKAVQRARPVNKVCRVQSQGCQYVTSFSKHWPCFFPQHGPGKKHERKIALETWQQQIVDTHPWDFIRGLIHSDGCRVINWTTRLVGGERKRYEYPRYFFTNKSDDIRKLFSDTLTAVGVEWTTLARGSDPWNISVARRASVALMDAHVGPKY
ncbi:MULTISPECIES: helix-turn-helix domain-containing protein [unclassified Streptomyces]|uniref:helix-turn-helix domain-containing protein n=1 Tax=unclassified Streptomyces TaxID=2593676 RepID=UPI0011CA1B88|nr:MULTISPECIES: helix-turn-helix domain-containing protein [unclassified Streptomyces]TXS08407.1 helix-turn-helix domain-containing protein [Streptomyces sp. wa22]WSQ87885.1 helix-turn-helix domain containing protein [Streptomyces sp. NBC_01212]WSR06107.1 helix-turn-helix domain containing protein [Streptomyces sp. NBC_01208]WSR51286.1 helix-turn-helix domain containing protein [Streptomyces sp. NBC_01201]